MSRFVPVLLAAAVLLPAPLAAQAVDVGKLDRRVGTLESEMRAVQRKVFLAATRDSSNRKSPPRLQRPHLRRKRRPPPRRLPI
ncbi:hypothetical protein [Sandarakinorhabdus limnophila]|uniref:hypothetical protein n=1 Tax=Sandarakinorhabdus limnophila TaxID=210512 RepID=UPI002352FAD4|nr:hypothetical protein [Sandarakinorhabdus limnophila]